MRASQQLIRHDKGIQNPLPSTNPQHPFISCCLIPSSGPTRNNSKSLLFLFPSISMRHLRLLSTASAASIPTSGPRISLGRRSDLISSAQCQLQQAQAQAQAPSRFHHLYPFHSLRPLQQQRQHQQLHHQPHPHPHLHPLPLPHRQALKPAIPAATAAPARSQAQSQSLFQSLSPSRRSHQSRTMSAMPASHGHSAACCNIPPVVSEGYTPKGSYEEVGGYKTYVTGPADATKAIVVIFDIFGYFDQTVQGADILAYSNDHQKYKVFMPDWFKGKPCPIEYYPPDTEEKQKALGAFFGEFPPPKIAGLVPAYVDAVKAHSPSVSKLAILGYCWGGKVAALAVKAPTNAFSAAAAAHPAMVDPADAEGLTVPFALLASKDENPEDVKKFEEKLQVPKHVETFGDQIHGWMAARSDLKNERVKAEYERGYKTLLEFFGKHL
ncbi:Alpha/Beta hydrolase protein [Trichoderma gracile]